MERNRVRRGMGGKQWRGGEGGREGDMKETLGDLYADVRLYSEVEIIFMTRRRWEGEMGGGSGRTYGKGRKEFSPEVGREGNVWGEEMAPPLQSCAPCMLSTASTCMIGFGNLGAG